MKAEAPRSNLAPACLLACLLGTGCDRPQPLGELALPGSSLSVEALARDALRGLAASDAMLLNRLRLTETEHNEVVWPELPASAPEIGFPVDFAWRNIQLRNESALERVAGWYRSNPVRYQVAECRGETRAFATFRVHTDCWVLFLTARGSFWKLSSSRMCWSATAGTRSFATTTSFRGAPVCSTMKCGTT